MESPRFLSSIMPTFTTTHNSQPKYNALRRPSQHRLSFDAAAFDKDKAFLNYLDTESVDTDLTAVDLPLKSRTTRAGSFSVGVCITLLNVSLLVGSVFCYYQTWYGKPLSEYGAYLSELKDFSYFSPLQDILQVPIRDLQINGSLFPGSPPPITRLPPSPEVDAFWESISHVTMFGISTADVERLGKDPKRAVRLPEAFGFPPGRHLAQLDTIHQIHCLNALRKAAYADYYRQESHLQNHNDNDNDQANKNEEAKPLKPKKLTRLHWIHLSHCTSILLENLMCNANLDVITLNWVHTQESPFPDFSVNKKCTDFNVIKQWAEDNALDENMLRRIKRPEDADEYEELQAPIGNIMDAFLEAGSPWEFDWGSM